MSDTGKTKYLLNRRKLLVRAGTGIAALVLGAYGTVRVVSVSVPRLESGGGLGELNELEMRAMVALAEVLVPSRYWVGPARTESVVSEATRTVPGLVQEYRNGASLIEYHAMNMVGRAFTDIDPPGRHELLGTMLWRYPGATGSGDYYIRVLQRRLERAVQAEPLRRFRELVVQDLIARLYVAAAPCVIGYLNLPGVPGDPREYVGPPGTDVPTCGAAGR